MTNKERYKPAVSALRSSPHLSLEVEEMAQIQKKHRFHAAMAAALTCAIILGGSGTAYAADIGGIRQKLSMWIHGSEKEVTVIDAGDTGYTFVYEKDGEMTEMGAGGVSIDADGTETWLYADELVEDMNRHAEVAADEKGRIQVYYYDQKIDITDLFDADGFCRIILSHDGTDSWLKIAENGGGGYHLTQGPTPEDDKELYTRISDK